MYIRLSKIMTKNYYQKILNEAINRAKQEYESIPNLSFNESIYNQLVDIKKTVVDENYAYTEAEADKKYPLGVMAIRNFDGYDKFEYKDMLVDISYGISRYPTMSEE